MPSSAAGLSDADWAAVGPHLPPLRRRPGRPADDRRFLDAVLWIGLGRQPWRRLPARFGRWSSVYRRFLRWRRQALFDRLLAELARRDAAPLLAARLDRAVQARGAAKRSRRSR
jgi:transposase